MPESEITPELREIGIVHLRYEVRMLVCHARTLLGRTNGLPDDHIRGFPNPAWDAILEAWLVHLRVLDEFFRLTRAHKGNAHARAWFKQWPAGGFLKPHDREAIEHQVVHLHAARRAMNEWAVWELTKSACEKFIEFCEVVRRHHPHRYEALEPARSFATKFLDATLGSDDCARERACFER